jgi:hypothetical protein
MKINLKIALAFIFFSGSNLALEQATVEISSGIGFVGDGVRDLYVNDDGVIYAATSYGLSVSHDTHKWQTFSIKQESKYIYLNSFLIKKNNIYLASNRGLFISFDSGKNFTQKKKIDGLADDIVFSLYANNTYLFVGTSAGLSIGDLAGNNFMTKNNFPGSFGNFVVKIHESNNYLVAEVGFLRFFKSHNNGDSWDACEKLHDYELNTLSSRTKFDQQNIYKPTREGLLVSNNSGNNFSLKKEQDGLADKIINNIFISPGYVYLASDNSIYVSRDTGKTYKPIIFMKPGFKAQSIFASPSGLRLYIGHNQGISLSYDGGKNFITKIFKKSPEKNLGEKMLAEAEAEALINQALMALVLDQ